MHSRISARLDESARAKLSTIRAETGQSVTEVITTALDVYYRSLRATASASNGNLMSLAGIFDGHADLSTRYKDELGEIIDDKFADHR
ncbi:MAG: hypothetical protein ACLGHY_04180 [Gammaproteobacteria bacterium]